MCEVNFKLKLRNLMAGFCKVNDVQLPDDSNTFPAHSAKLTRQNSYNLGAGGIV